MHDAIVVGAGPAGTAAAYALRERDVLVLDVGFQPPDLADPRKNVFELRQSEPDLFDFMIGERFEALHNLHRRPISLKLKSPRMTYIAREWQSLSPLVSDTFETTMSFAQGGLASAWGAGVYRFTDRDLATFPICAADLNPWYDLLTEHIGVSGGADDLSGDFGSTEGLLPPMRLSGLASDLLRCYERRRDAMRERGLRIGLPRLSVLTRPHRGREAYRYENLEFFRSRDPAVYNPAYTLNELVDQRRVRYRTHRLVLRYEEHQDHVEVVARNIDDGVIERFRGRQLFLGAGTLNTAKLVLQSKDDHTTRLPLLDNPMSCIPLLRLGRIGAALDVYDTSFSQLAAVFDQGPGRPLIQGSVYGTTGPLRSDVLFDFPLALSANLTACRALAPAILLLMLFYPASHAPGNFVRLRASGEIEVFYGNPSLGEAEGRIISALRRLGFLGLLSLCQYPPAGTSLHYAGTLPMSQQPGPYQTHTDGRLFGSERVYVTDGANFSALPAKNHTLTIMANAMRVAAGATEAGR